MKSVGKRARSILFSRAVMTAFLILIQLLILLLFIVKLSNYFAFLYVFFIVLSLLMGLYVINRPGNPSYKMAWVLLIVLLPLVGGAMYLIFGQPRTGWGLAKYFKRVLTRRDASFAQNCDVMERLEEYDSQLATQAKYTSAVGYPVYGNSAARFFPSGEAAFEEMKKALREAKRYIFLEYFIIEEGTMWNQILDILTEKAAQGVEVRVLYDGFGCILTLPSDYTKQLAARGIHASRLLPVVPILTAMLNNRDHRKITVIDGTVAFTGGYNLADEYINAIERCGHWKDAGVMVRGEAAFAFTRMFLTMWEAATTKALNIEKYRPLEPVCADGGGFVQPYASNPLNPEDVAEMVYLNLIHRSQEYVYICTPYLVLDDAVSTALCLAARSGVDVRILTPHIPDKWYVLAVTRAYYPQLLEAGVRIYEYTPGFVHAKTMVSDDRVATVGSVNLDYRSLSLHFECGVWLTQSDTVRAVRDDFLKTLSVSEEITMDSEIIRPGLTAGLVRGVLRVFAPLM